MPADMLTLVQRLRKRLAEASPQPWVYRPDQFDDWGWIRGTERDDRGIGPYRPVMAIARDSSVRDQDETAHRAAGTDPYGPNALLITDAVNALPGLLDTIEAQARRIEALEGEARHASDLLLTLCRVTKHRTIDPSVPLAKNMLDTAERLAALSPEPTP